MFQSTRPLPWMSCPAVSRLASGSAHLVRPCIVGKDQSDLQAAASIRVPSAIKSKNPGFGALMLGGWSAGQLLHHPWTRRLHLRVARQLGNSSRWFFGVGRRVGFHGQ